jgi:hypothetical protein
VYKVSESFFPIKKKKASKTLFLPFCQAKQGALEGID